MVRRPTTRDSEESGRDTLLGHLTPIMTVASEACFIDRQQVIGPELSPFLEKY